MPRVRRAVTPTAPCVDVVPGGVDVPAFVAAIARDEPDEAARIIFAENLLGGTCARVCPVELLCEGACVLHHEGRKPVEVGRLQRFASDARALDRRRRSARRAPLQLAARRRDRRRAGRARVRRRARRARLRGHRLRRAARAGRPRRATRSRRIACSREPLPSEARVLAELGVSFELGMAIDSPEALACVAEDADAVVLAVGMGADADVHYPGDELPGVWESLPFIEAIKTGHAARRRRRTSCVVGGGNTAVDVAREARRLGAERRHAPLPADRGGDARVSARGRGGARGGRAARVADRPASASSAASALEAVECRRTRARRARRERPARARRRSRAPSS